ncbi:MAG: hypothetical protein KTR30_27370 [Saprospiraceae bacterium]|nr:hypothetical protein [Saprospiraceae bacterium]
MEIALDIANTLLELAVKKGDRNLDRFGIIELSSLVNEKLPTGYRPLGQRYLYDTLYLNIQQAQKNKRSTIPVDRSCMDSLAFFVGFQSLEDFIQYESPQLPPSASSILGNWYSIVRCNSGLPDLLLSPVQISLEKNQVAHFQLKGPHRLYGGKVKWIGSSISCFLESNDKAKTLHLAFMLGVAKKPKVLIGVFSGVSTSGLPIAGKELLLRSDEAFEDLQNQRIPIQEGLLPDSILNYFKHYDSCYFKVQEASTFDFLDLQ